MLNEGDTLEILCHQLPKAELHVHIEGTLDPETMFKIAERNNLLSKLPYANKSIEEVKKRYNFNNLEEFLDIYYISSSILIKEEDFSQLVVNYFNQVIKQGVKYAEIFFDLQSHTRRGISLRTVINGLLDGLKYSEDNLGVKGSFILCFLRDLSEEDAMETFNDFIQYTESTKTEYPYVEKIIGIGLDSSEIGNPPEKFKNIFRLAKEKGFKSCCHCHDEGSLENIRTAVEELQVDRIDHGLDINLDHNLLKECVRKKIPFTFCPLSTRKVQRTPDLKIYQIDKLLKENLLITVNSDDPAFFGGYIGDNYAEFLKVFNLSKDDLIKLCKNSFSSSFLKENEKKAYIELLDKHLKI